ncbi:hypothetical protein MTO96_025287 [Rhipicephalus appendiculatus]
MASNLVVVGVLLAASLIGTCRAQLKDGCKIETLRACGDDFVPYGKKTELLSSGEAFEKRCGKLQEELTCSSKFINTCMDGLAKVASTVAVAAFEEDVESICSVGSERHEGYVKAVGCMNSVGKKLNSCWKDIPRNSAKGSCEGTRQGRSPLPVLVTYTTICTTAPTSNLKPCESTGGKDFALDLLQRVFGDAVGLVCGKHKKGSDACRALPKLPALGANDRKVENYVELLVEAVSTIGVKN